MHFRLIEMIRGKENFFKEYQYDSAYYKKQT